MFKVDENILLDSFQKSGNTFEGLKEVLDALTGITQFMKWKSGDIELLSYIGRDTVDVEKKDGTGKPVLDKEGKIQVEKIPVVSSILLTPGNLPSSKMDVPIDTLQKGYRENSVRTPELLREWTEISRLAFIFNDSQDVNAKRKFYLASSNALQTMDRFGMAGSFLGEPSLERDSIIAKRFEKDLGITVVARSVNGTKKIFSILSDKYTHINQDVLFSIVKAIEKDSDMGEAKCYRWEVNNFFTKLYIEFPQKAEELSVLYGLKKQMIPGILMTTSDTGDSSLKIYGTWRVEGRDAVSVHTEVKRKHIGDIKIKDIINDVTEKIFVEYAKLPEALCNLMGEDITDPSWDLTTSAGIMANKARMENVIRAAFRKVGVSSNTEGVGKKMEKQIYEALIDELDYTIAYTAYDIAMMIMMLPERVGLMDNKKDLSKLQKACSKAPFIKYEEDKKDKIVLV